ncbi:MAG: hypothetical protein ACXABO_20235 [Promethearchaeota archaeon]
MSNISFSVDLTRIFAVIIVIWVLSSDHNIFMFLDFFLPKGSFTSNNYRIYDLVGSSQSLDNANVIIYTLKILFNQSF